MSATTMLGDTASGTQRRSPTYQVLVDDIKALGVEQVFGLMSDDTAVFATALDSSGIRFYGARHENNAIAMAEGFSYATGGLGVAVIGRGPATANGLHAATYASRAGSRVLIIFGDMAVSSGAVNSMGPDYKAFNSTGVLAAAGIRTFVATSPETARGALADAAGAAPAGDRSGRRPGAAEPQALDRRGPGRASCRRQGGARAACRSHRCPAGHLGARQGHVSRPSLQSRNRRFLLAFRRPADDRPGGLRPYRSLASRRRRRDG